MPIPLALILLQTKPKIDPQIAREWTAAAATGMKSAVLDLRSDGRFALNSVDDAGKPSRIQGTYAVDAVPKAGATGKMATAKMVVFTYDLPGLREAGASKAEVDKLVKAGKRGAVGMRLFFFAEVPVLTDIVSAHFVPVKGRDAALKKLAKWKPF